MNDGQVTDGASYLAQDQKPTPPTTVYITREVFLSSATQRIRYKDVPIEGFGVVKIKNLTDREYSRLQAATMKPNGQMDKLQAQAADAALCCECTLNPDNTPMFTESDIPALRDRDAGIISSLAQAIREHIGLPEADAEKK